MHDSLRYERTVVTVSDHDQVVLGPQQLRVLSCVCVHGIGHRDTLPGHTADQVAASVSRGVRLAGGTVTTLDTPQEDRLTRRLRLQVRGEDVVVDFYDARWSHLVQSPRLPRVLWWAVQVAPVLPMALAASWYGDRMQDPPGRLTPLLMRPRAVLSSFLVLVAALLVVPSALLILAVASAIPACRGLTHRVLVDVLGDAWLYRSTAMDQVVIPEIVQIAQRVATRSDRVMLVGHSQGAELTRRASLRGRPPDVCMWVGSGEAPLTLLRVLSRHAVLPLLMWVMYFLYPPMLVLIAAHAGRLFDDVVAWAVAEHPSPLFSTVREDLVKVLIPLLVFVVLVLLRGQLIHSPVDINRRARSVNVQIKSLTDPVSYGSSNRKDILRFVHPTGVRDAFLAHITYFSNPATGLCLLEALLGSDVVPEAASLQSGRLHPVVYLFGSACLAVVVALVWWLGTWQLSWVGWSV